jgi:hypothetical protein
LIKIEKIKRIAVDEQNNAFAILPLSRVELIWPDGTFKEYWDRFTAAKIAKNIEDERLAWQV